MLILSLRLAKHSVLIGRLMTCTKIMKRVPLHSGLETPEPHFAILLFDPMMTTMDHRSPEPCSFEDLSSQSLFRILELFPGKDGEPISCSTHVVDLHDPPKYEAISYVWGDVRIKNPVSCNGGILNVTANLYRSLLHLLYPSQSRFLWVDALW